LPLEGRWMVFTPLSPCHFTILGRTSVRSECAAELIWTFRKREKSLNSTGIWNLYQVIKSKSEKTVRYSNKQTTEVIICLLVNFAEVAKSVVMINSMHIAVRKQTGCLQFPSNTTMYIFKIRPRVLNTQLIQACLARWLIDKEWCC
jgi:hypothetical protein